MISQIRPNIAQTQSPSFKRRLTKDEMAGLECSCEKTLISVGQAIGRKEIRAEDGVIEQLSPLRSSYIRAIKNQLTAHENKPRNRKELRPEELLGLVSRAMDCEGNYLASIAIDLGRKKISPKRALAQVIDLEANTVKSQFTPLPNLRQHLESMISRTTKQRVIDFAAKSVETLHKIVNG